MVLKVLVVIQGACLALIGIAVAVPASQDVAALRVVGAAAALVGLGAIAFTLLGSHFLERRPLLLLLAVTAVLGINLGSNADGKAVRLAWFVYAFGAALAALAIALRRPPDPAPVTRARSAERH